MGFALAPLLGAMTYSSADYFLLNIGLIPFSPVALYAYQLLIVPGIVSFARKIAAENHEKMKTQAVIRIDGSWTHRRNGSTQFVDMADVGSERVVDFETVQKTTASGGGNYQHGFTSDKRQRVDGVVRHQEGRHLLPFESP
jgi:hypothetical protein